MDYDYRTGFVTYPDAEPGTPAAKAPHVDHGTDRIDPRRYYSQDEADQEWDHMWTKSWFFAGLAHDIPEVGDWFKVELGRESFIVVRTGDQPGDVAAHYNVCPHRGNRIAHDDFGSVGAGGCFQCDFHGWQFGLNGANAKIRDEFIFRQEAIAHRPGLKSVHSGVWNSLVFISLADQPIPLLEHLDVMPEHLKVYPFDKYRVLRDIEVVWNANWKTALDAFVEFYHADDVHPEVVPFSETLECQYDLYGHGLSRMIIAGGLVTSRFEDRDTPTAAVKGMVEFYGGNNQDYAHLKGHEYSQALADTRRKWAKRHGYDHFDQLSDGQVTDDWNYYVFPNITINVFSDTLLIQVFMPHRDDPEKSRYRAISMALPVPGTNDMVMDVAAYGPEALSPPGWDGVIRPPIEHPETYEGFGPVLAQDAVRVPEIQKGLRSRSYDGYVLSESEVRIRHYLAEIDRYLGRPGGDAG